MPRAPSKRCNIDIPVFWAHFAFVPLTPAEKDLCGALTLTLAYLEGAGEWEQAEKIRGDIRDVFDLGSIPPQRGKNTA